MNILVIYILVFCIFLSHAAVGLLFLPDYGVSADEPYERNTSIVTSAYVAQRVSNAGKALGLFELELPDIPDFSQYKDRYYGDALHYPLVLAEVAGGFRMDSRTVYLMRHINVFAIFFLSLICFFLILRDKFSSCLTALLGVLFLCLFLRFFAEAFYNNKDVLFASSYIIVSYFNIRFFKTPSLPNVFLAAISLAFALNTRIIAFFAAFILLLLFISRMIREKSVGEIKWLGLYAAVSFCVFILITPGYWLKNPFAALYEALTLFSNYPYPYPVFFMGQFFESSALPWYYIPVWMLITVPLLYIMLFLPGVILTAAGIKRGGCDYTDAFMLLSFSFRRLPQS